MADSAQPRLHNTREVASWLWSFWEVATETDVPAWGRRGRDAYLRDFAHSEPILSGAISSMVSKVTSMDWRLTGSKRKLRKYQEMLATADGGWTVLLEKWLQDYLCADNGGMLELGRESEAGPVNGVWHLDTVRCLRTGRVDFPIYYYPDLPTGRAKGFIPFSPLDYGNVVDMPSPDERMYGLGFCTVSRAYRSAKLLLALYRYDEEKLADMPLPGIVSVTGLTMDEVSAAFDLYDAKRAAKEQVTFKGLLWLAAQGSSVTPIDARLVSFASLPEGFDRDKAITTYVYTLALDFNVDVREFWPASQVGATKAEAEIQHQKAKGKGIGRILANLERTLTWHVLPRGMAFSFDQKDTEEDLAREDRRRKASLTIRELWEPPQGGAQGIISTEEARLILVQEGVLPEWLTQSPTGTVYESEGDSLAPEASVGIVEDDAALPAVTMDGTENLAAKAARYGVEPGDDLAFITGDGVLHTLWRPVRVFDMFKSVEQRAAAQATLEHLRAAQILAGSYAN